MLSRLIQIIVSIAVVIVIAAFYAVLNLDLNDYKKQIEAATFDATGRKLTLDGDVSLSWSLIPTLAVKQARFANAEWGSRPDMVSLGSLELRLALYPLLNKEIQITRVHLSQPVIVLETNEQGEGNWVLETKTTEQASTNDNEASSIQSAIVNVLSIEEATIIYKDGVTQDEKQLVLHQFTMEMSDLVSPFSIVLDAIVDEFPVTLTGQAGGLQHLIDNQPASLDLEGDIAGVALTVSGNIAKPHTAKGVNLTLNIDSDDKALAALSGQTLPEFGEIMLAGTVRNELEGDVIHTDLTTTLSGLTLWLQGQANVLAEHPSLDIQLDLKTDTETLAELSDAALPEFGDVTLTGQLSGNAKEITLSQFALVAGESDLSGEVFIALKDIPEIEATLSAKQLDITLLAQQDGPDEVAEEKPTSDKVFSDDPIVLDALKQVNAAISLKVDKLTTAAADLDDMTIGVNLQQGHLIVAPFTAGFAGSQIDANVDLDARKEQANLSSKLQINGFKLTEMNALKDTISGGNSDVYIQTSAQGASVAQLMASLNGKAVMKVGKSQIADGTLDLLGADFLNKLVDMINPFAKETKGTELSCAVVNMVIKDGVATAKKGIAVQTKNLNILGNGTINLKNERLDIDFKPKARSGVGLNLSQLAGLVKVGGTLAKPSAQLDKAAVLETGVTGAAAVATGGLSVVAQGLVDKATAKNPCDVALGLTEQQ